MPLGIYRHKYLTSSTQHPVTADDQGNVGVIQIRGTEVCLGDDARCTARNTVAIGNGVVNSMASSAVIGANSTVLVNATQYGLASTSTTTNVSTGATLTAAQIGGGALINVTAGGAGLLTLPTAASLDAFYTSNTSSMSWSFYINNSAGGNITLTTNTGITLASDTPTTTAISTGDSVIVRIRKTGTAAYAVSVVGRVQGGGSGGVIIAGGGANSFMYTGATAAAGAASQAMGLTASSAGDNSIAIGRDATSSADSAISIGYASDATVANAIAIGGDSLGVNGAQATSTGAIAIGRTSVASNTQSVAIGVSSTASGVNSVCLGQISTATGQGTITIGTSATGSADNAICIGRVGDATANAAIAIGCGAQATAQEAIAIGGDSGELTPDAANATGIASIAIGTNSLASGIDSIALGSSAAATSQGAIAIGLNSFSPAGYNIAIGYTATTDASGSQICIGAQASTSSGVDAVAIGTGAAAVGASSVALGPGSTTSASNAIALGSGGVNANANSVLLSANALNMFYGKTSGAVIAGGVAVDQASYKDCSTTAQTLNAALPFNPGIILVGSPSGGVAYTLDTGANYDTQFPHFVTSDSFTFSIVNNGTATITLTAALGSTISGTATVAADFTRVYQLQKTGVATWVATSLDVQSHLAAAGGTAVVLAGAGTNSMRYTTGTAAGNYTVSLGDGIALPNADSIGIGRIDTNNSTYGIAIGKGTLVSSATAGVAIGCRAVSGGTQAIAIGGDTTDAVPPAYLGAQAVGNQSIAIGAACDALNASCIGIGYQAVSSANYNTAIGDNASATTGNYQISIGKNCSSTASSGIAIGNRSTATGTEAIAIGGDSADIGGAGADATGAQSIALGTNSTASATNAAAFGNSASATAASAHAIGHGVTNAVTNTINLGANSTNMARINVNTLCPSGQAQSNTYYNVQTVASMGAARTLTAQEISSFAILKATALDAGMMSMAGAETWTTPSATDLLTRTPQLVTGDTWTFRIINADTNMMGSTITLAAGAGISFAGTTTVTSSAGSTFQEREYLVNITNAGTPTATITGIRAATVIN